MTDCEYKFGFTGTLDGTQTHKLVLEGLFGPVHNVTTSKELMDADLIAQLHIEAITLGYTDEEKKLVKGMLYADEIDWLVKCQKRNEFICTLALTRDSNTLILYQFVQKHGEKLFKYLKEKSPDRPVFFVSGEIKTEVSHPVKSRIRNLQSVGRGLRKCDNKSKATLFDISDDLSWKKHKNYSLRHFLERVKIYNSEKFDYKLRKIRL